MQGWESDFCWVGGIPVVENRNKIQMFKFLCSNGKLPKSCSLEDIDPVFKIFQKY